MKRIVISIVLVLLGCCLALGQAKQATGQSVVQEITALENAWIQAGMKYDVAWFEQNLADSYIGTDEDGVVWDKAGIVANVKNKVQKTESVSYEKLKVQPYGTTAIATGVTVTKGTFKGKDISGKYPWTDTWVKLNGRWQCVAGHNSKLASK